MISELHIQTALRDGITFLKGSYLTQPFKLANITEDKKSNLLRLMLMSSSPGILSGDVYDIKIDIAADSALQLQTQSYQRLYNMKAEARQTMRVNMESGASFFYLPHPSVPHANASFSAVNEIRLEKNCSLLWGEVITCGRKGSGESFLFSRFHNITKIFIENKLVIKENILIEPQSVDVSSIGQLEGFTHQATMIYLNETFAVKELRAMIIAFLSQAAGVEYGISEAPCNGVIVRILGYRAEQLFDLFQSIANKFILQNYSMHVG